MKKRKQTRLNAGTHHIKNNVVNLFPKQEMVDPLKNELLIEACRDWFNRGDVSPSGMLTKYVNDMPRQDRLDYGLHATILVARSPCLYKTHEDIYLKFMTDGRLPRICQFVFCAHINNRDLTRNHVDGFLGIIGKQLEAITGKSNGDCVDVLIAEGLIKDVEGQLLCTRKLGYYTIEMVAFFADTMQMFSSVHRENIFRAWNKKDDISGHNTHWLPITAPLERHKREKRRDQK